VRKKDDVLATSFKTCLLELCYRNVKTAGYCGMHYQRIRKHGDPIYEKHRVIHGSLAERFWPRVLKTDGCWIWAGPKTPNGYGRIYVSKNKPVGAHRVAYELLVGPIPSGFELDHTCHTRACDEGDSCPHRACVNVDHLEPVTHEENIRRSNFYTYDHKLSIRKRKAVCKQGHPYAGDNLSFDRKGSQVCRACQKTNLARYRERLRAKELAR
jgi:hypothetical protein